MDRLSADRIPLISLAVLVLVAFAFGGGGQRFGLANLVVQLTALGVLAMRRDGFVAFWRQSPLVLRILVAASLALPLIQIIPLPEPVWTALPGRDLAVRSWEQAGSSGWLPLSLDPLRTLLAVTALITPLAVLFAGWTLPRERLIDIGWLVVGLGLFTILQGAVQLTGASGTATFYGNFYQEQVLLGTFANRNSVGIFLAFTVALAALLPLPLARPHAAALPARLAVCGLLLLGIVLTQSRTSIALAMVPVLLGAARALGSWWGARGEGRTGQSVVIGLGALALLGVAGAAVLATAPGRIGTSLERFEAKDDPRRFIWEDATFSAGRYWPLGAGTGTFDEVYQVDESLENLTKRRAGRAHNDYIELAVESGGAGLVLAACWLAMLAWLTWRARASSHRWTAFAASSFLLVIALQSITDYPLRNQTILAMAAFALLLLTRIATDRTRARA